MLRADHSKHKAWKLHLPSIWLAEPRARERIATMHFTPQVQLELLGFIEMLARAVPFNLENLSVVGCVELLLDMIQPYLLASSPLLSHALRIIEILGAYRLSTLELRLLMRYILQMRQMSSRCNLAE